MARTIQRTFISPNGIHHLRYVRNKVLGMSIEKIAEEDGVDEKYIKKSISQVEAYHAMNTMDDLKTSQVEVVLFNAEMEKLAIHNALQAEDKVYSPEGELLDRRPNHEIQLAAVKVVKDIAESLLGSSAKVPLLPSTNTTQVNIMTGGSTGIGIATFEDRLREVKRKRTEQNILPASSSEETEEVRPDWEGPDESSKEG